MNGPAPTIRHSRLGIASVVIGGGLPLLVPLLMSLSVAFGSDVSGPGDEFNKHLRDAFAIAFIVVGLLAVPLHLTGLIFGLIGLRATDRKKSFSIAGIVLNTVFGLVGAGIVCFFISNPSLTAFR